MLFVEEEGGVGVIRGMQLCFKGILLERKEGDNGKLILLN